MKRKVTFNEVANKMGMNPTELKLLFDLSNVASLDETVDDDREISAIEKIKDSNSTPQEFVLEDEKRHLINDAMERLSPREQEIIKYRYNSEDGVLHSFAEVAEKLGISRQRVQKIEQKAIKEMKEYIKNCEK
ncbi:MAG: sigma-70 family RNA polymerase sigma factor [Bacilli bacterium]